MRIQTKPQSNVTPFTMIAGKTLDVPQSEPAEEALIASILANPSIYHSVSTSLCDGRAAFFYLRCAYIYDAMAKLVSDNTAIDVVTLSELMLNDETMSDSFKGFGGPAYFTRLMSNNIHYRNYIDYVNIVNATYKRRVMLQTADDLRKAAMDNEVPVQSSINTAYSHLDRLNDKSRTFTTISDGLQIHVEMAEDALNNPNSGIPSGIKILDDLIDGFHNRRVYVIAARTHHGKTAFMLSVALNAAKVGKRIGIFNVADGNSQDVISRLVGMEASLKGHEILMGRLKPQEFSRYIEASSKLAKLPIYIESKKGMTLPELLISARNMKYRYGLDMICIDYIQRIGIDTSKQGAPQDKVHQLSYISTAITKLADEDCLNIPIVIGAQLNRGAVGKEPAMSDIQGCGGIEQDADVVSLPYRKDLKSDRMILIVDKNKVNGVIGSVNVSFEQKSTLISDIDYS